METEALGAAHAASEFSFFGLFLEAGLFVKAVMISLIISSIWTWAIIIDKQASFGSLRRQVRKFEGTFWAGRSLDDLAQSLGEKPKDPMSRIFAAAMREWRDARQRGAATREPAAVMTLTERIDRVMGLVVSREIESAERGLGVLASVGSAAPFIGLLGTVWGIMNSFRAIAVSRDTNLAVVAPGIAEALFATALGLMAAIPAVIFYNKFSSDLARHAGELEGFADELSAILSRRLSDRGA